MKKLNIPYDSCAEVVIELEIEDIQIDSRKVQNNDLFVSLTNESNKFIEDAIARGASAILSNIKIPINNNEKVKFIFHSAPELILPKLLQIFYSPKPSYIFAVTGTNGKTSVTHFTQQLIGLIKGRAVAIGTTGIIANYDINLKEIDKSNSAGTLTTLDIVSLHKILHNLKTIDNVDHVAIEASSHGIKQGRLSGLNIKYGAFTNLTQDHLDYHESMENYFQAKSLLFSDITQTHAVINSDTPQVETLKSICLKRGVEIIDYGRNAEILKLININTSHDKQTFSVKYNNKVYEMQTQLMGEYQIMNILCAIGFCLSSGMAIEEITAKVDKLTAAKGRLERVILPNGTLSNVYIDYAHTPDALQNVLKTAKKLCKGKLLVVFGCGGNRDKTKRPIMGQIATEIADIVIVTDDNPRNEDASTIREEVISGSKSRIFNVGNRGKAIEKAISLMNDSDVLIIAGKGHENYQIIGDEKIHFDDAEEALKYLGSQKPTFF